MKIELTRLSAGPQVPTGRQEARKISARRAESEICQAGKRDGDEDVRPVVDRAPENRKLRVGSCCGHERRRYVNVNSERRFRKK